VKGRHYTLRGPSTPAILESRPASGADCHTAATASPPVACLSKPDYLGSVFLYITPSFMMTFMFFSGLPRILMSSNGSPSTMSRSA
jgi:hypothetical protein